MKPSVITVCFNSQDTIKRNIESVNSQNANDIEHIFIDGGSIDRTVDLIVASCTNAYKLVSEVDGGIYDAMNKGVALASGDFVGFLNSDDWYSDSNVISDVASIFSKSNVDFVFGDIKMWSNSGKLVRHWKSHSACAKSLDGRQIPHPAFFVRTTALKRLTTPFDSTYKISADLKQQLILINKLHCVGHYLPRSLANMSIGGASTKNLNSYLNGWRECIRAYNDVFGGGGLYFTLRKVLSKISSL